MVTAHEATVLASKREEIIAYILVLQRRRGRDSTIKLSVLAAILAARFNTLAKSMRWFVTDQLSGNERTEFRIIDDRGFEPVQKKPIKKIVDENPEFIIEWITVADLKACAAGAKRESLEASGAARRKRIQPPRAEQEIANRDRRLCEREAKRAAALLERTRLKEERDAERQRAREEKAAGIEREKLERRQARIARRTARLQKDSKPKETPPVVTMQPVQKQKPRVAQKGVIPTPSKEPTAKVIPPVVVRQVPPRVVADYTPRRARPDIPTSVLRAIRALKGAREITEHSVIERAAMYCNEPKEEVAAYVKKISTVKRIEMGFDPIKQKRPPRNEPVSPHWLVKKDF